jgi:hypothetical protein
MKNRNTIPATSNQVLLPEKPQTLPTRQETPSLSDIKNSIHDVCKVPYTLPDGTPGGKYVSQKGNFSEQLFLAPRYPVQARKAQCNIKDDIRAGYHNNGITICAETVTNSDHIAVATESDEGLDPNNSDCEDGMDKEGLDAVKTAMKNPGETSIEPLPLERAVNNSEPYPLEALGSTLELAASDLYTVVQAADGICAHGILGFATHAVQGFANVAVDGRTYPLNNNFLSIASRSARKSEVDRKAGLVHREIEKKLLEEYQRALDVYRDESEIYKTERDKITKDKGATMPEKNDALAKLREKEPKPPLNPLLVFSDPTVQGMYKLFKGGTPSKYLCADEGGQISGGHSMKHNEKMYSSTVYSKYWDGDSIPRIRGGDGASCLEGVRLSMHLMMQDNVAANFFNDGCMRDQGLISRFLVTYPSSLVGSRGYKAEDVAKSPGMLAFYEHVRKILSEPLPLRIDEETGQPRNELEPRSIHLEEDAKQLWVEAYEGIEAASGKGRRFESIEGFAGKAPNHMIRLAGVMALFDDIHRETVPVQYMENAITLVQYYLNERLRISAMASPDLEIENAKILLAWIQKKDLRFVTLPDIYQSGPNRFRNKKQAAAAASTLENHHWLIKKESGVVSELSGKKSNAAWKVNRTGF